jgi:hypothetical protein
MNYFAAGADSTIEISAPRLLYGEAAVQNWLTLQLERMDSSSGAER